MKPTFFLPLALLVLSLASVNCKTASTILNTGLFDSPPVKVYDATSKTNNGTDIKAFSDIPTTQIAFSAGITNDTLHVWSVYCDGNFIRSVNRRDINATIVAMGNDTSEASVIRDMLMPTAISCASKPIFSSGPGYFAIAVIGFKGESPRISLAQVCIYLFTSKENLPKKIQLTGFNKTSFTYQLGSFWYQTGTFYLTWKYYDRSVSNYTIYLQGVSTSGKKQYSSPITVVNMESEVGNFFAGSSNCSESNYIYVLYTFPFPDPSYLYRVQITKSTGEVGTPHLLANYTKKTTWNGYYEYDYYLPAGLIGSNITNGIALLYANITDTSISYRVLIYFNGTSKFSNDSGLIAPDGYDMPSIISMTYPGGYVIIANYLHIEDDTVNAYVYQTFFSNGTASGPQTYFGFVRGPVNIFVDSNGALWFAYTTYNSTSTLTGMIGKLFPQIYDPPTNRKPLDDGKIAQIQSPAPNTTEKATIPSNTTENTILRSNTTETATLSASSGNSLVLIFVLVLLLIVIFLIALNMRRIKNQLHQIEKKVNMFTQFDAASVQGKKRGNQYIELGSEKSLIESSPYPLEKNPKE